MRRSGVTKLPFTHTEQYTTIHHGSYSEWDTFNKHVNTWKEGTHTAANTADWHHNSNVGNLWRNGGKDATSLHGWHRSWWDWSIKEDEREIRLGTRMDRAKSHCGIHVRGGKLRIIIQQKHKKGGMWIKWRGDAHIISIVPSWESWREWYEGCWCNWGDSIS